MVSAIIPKPSKPAPIVKQEKPKEPETTQQLAPKVKKTSSKDQAKGTSRFRVDLGGSGSGSGLNIPT